ncbi:PRTRC system protein E [Sphingobacterium siyangense]|uniref:PRTRC system protein E n=1 Tax=Sphingobacterium siyangense TaxID=459529 RepID=UPI002FDD3C4D
METANFFRQISKMDINSKLTLTIAKATDSKIIISIFIENDACGDKAKNIIPPFNLTGTPEELDNGFFDHIRKPIKTADGLISNMDSFMQQLETSKAHSAMEKNKSEKEKKNTDSKNKKFTDAMAKAEALEKRGKFKEAWSALPKVSEFPEQKEIIRKKQEMYEREFAPLFFSYDEEEEIDKTEIQTEE